jgi:LuxR family transcriptional regulator, maltose regulon positive regulatory protein
MHPLRSAATACIPPPPVRIRTLECFDLFVDGAPLEFEGRGPRKPLELLSALVVSGPRGASVGAIADLLWPDADGFDAYRALITTVHRLRRLLVHRAAIHFGAGRLRLEPTVCDIDVWQFERTLEEVRNRTQLEAALDLYSGPFLGDDTSAWAIGMRSRLEQAIARATRKVTLQAGRPGDAMTVVVRHQVPPRQFYTAVGYGDHRDVGASPRCRVEDRRMERGPE